MQRFAALAAELSMVMVLPIYEEEQPGVYYNTAVVVDADGSILGSYRKHHIPNLDKFWEKFYFRPGNLGYPVFKTAVGPIGVYICYDRHFPEGWRELGLNGAQIVFNPNATKPGLSNRLWEIEQPAAAAANGYFVAAPNRVGREDNEYGDLAVDFYGSSQFVRPAGQRRRWLRQRHRGGGRHPRPRPGHDPYGPQRLAVLPGPAAGLVRGHSSPLNRRPVTSSALPAACRCRSDGSAGDLNGATATRDRHFRQNRWCVTPLGLGTTSRWNRSSSSSGDSHSRTPGSEFDLRHRHVQGVDEVGLEELTDGGGATAEADVLARCLRSRPLEDRSRISRDEVEGGIGQGERRALVMGQHEDRGVERRLVTPPAAPLVINPRPALRDRTCSGP